MAFLQMDFNQKEKNWLLVAATEPTLGGTVMSILPLRASRHVGTNDAQKIVMVK